MLLGSAPQASQAQSEKYPIDSAPATIGPAQSVAITATRIAKPRFDVPASIDLVQLLPDTATRAGINISETLGAVAGLLARDRQNYAQDVQISVR